MNNSSVAWACTSLGTCITGFATYAVPVLQVIALTISIVAGIIAIRKSRRP